MGQIRQSLKIIEKSEEDIDSLKAAVESLSLSDDEKETLIYGLYLIVWLPKLILEQAISMFRLKELLFGKSTRKSSPKKSKSKPDDGKANQNDDLEQPNDSSANDEQLEEPLEANDNTTPLGIIGIEEWHFSIVEFNSIVIGLFNYLIFS